MESRTKIVSPLLAIILSVGFFTSGCFDYRVQRKIKRYKRAHSNKYHKKRKKRKECGCTLEYDQCVEQQES